MARTKRQRREEDAGADTFEGAPLYDELPEMAYIMVSRDDPEEGVVGKLPPHATEMDLRKKYGGGTYTLTARSAGGKHIKGGHLSVTIAGDPIFQSQAAENRWRKAMGLGPGGAGEGRAPQGERPVSMLELMMLMDKQAERARQEAREFSLQREQEQQRNHDRQLELMRLQLSGREREIAAERERIDRESKERSERLDREMKAEQQRQREFMQTMLQIMQGREKEKGSDVERLIQGMELMRSLGGVGDDDPLTALVKNAGPILGEARRLVTAEAEAKRANGADVEELDEEDDDEGVTLEGPLAEKARALVDRLRAQGKDPETELARYFDLFNRHAEQRAVAAAAPEPAPPPAPQKPAKNRKRPPTSPPRKATAPAKPGTTEERGTRGRAKAPAPGGGGKRAARPAAPVRAAGGSGGVAAGDGARLRRKPAHPKQGAADRV